MKKVEPVVIKETKYIAACVAVMSVLMQSVFLIIGRWDYTVLLGNVLSASASVLNFFLMGLTVQKAVNRDEKEAKTLMKVSQMYRMLLLLAVAVVGAALPVFNLWAVLIPLLFSRVALAIRPMLGKRMD
jgi:hypothetical protein